jgi:hypothetical protein
MKASEAVKRIQALIEKHGDVELFRHECGIDEEDTRDYECEDIEFRDDEIATYTGVKTPRILIS